MPYINIDVDIDDILSSLGSREEKKLFEGLLDTMKFSDVKKMVQDKFKDQNTSDLELSTFDSEFHKAALKLVNNRWRLGLSDEMYIIQLADKL